ncbi:MAG: nucleoside triphosphate pyrophosphohydrolase [Polyangiaceae bacterium]|nr:nucleoside triphosphate pyrophosphohydrolase [Polyangiaceae bacterium]
MTPPPLAEQRGASYVRLVALMQRLLEPDGCPWDREQSFESLRRYVTEEAAEVVDAVDGGDRGELCEELGDLLLQVVFMGELGRAEGTFGPDDIVAAIIDKLVRRHPHVFGDAATGAAGPELSTSGDVLRNWEKLKLSEKKAKREGALASVPRSLPALVRAQRIGEKAARVGFDWPDARGVTDKLHEEVRELEAAVASGDARAISAELGDVLFALTNVARHTDVDAEAALRGTIDRFCRRFAHVEDRVTERHGGFAAGEQLSLEVLDGYWDEAKAAER